VCNTGRLRFGDDTSSCCAPVDTLTGLLTYYEYRGDFVLTQHENRGSVLIKLSSDPDLLARSVPSVAVKGYKERIPGIVDTEPYRVLCAPVRTSIPRLQAYPSLEAQGGTVDLNVNVNVNFKLNVNVNVN